MKFSLLVLALITYTHGLPRRYRREDAQITYGPCKNTYDQCPQWKEDGMCTKSEYKDYMATVCPVTCEYCKDSSSSSSTTSDEFQTARSEPSPSSEPIVGQISTATDDQSISNAERTPTSETSLASATKDTSTSSATDHVMSDYENQLKQYYDNIQKQRAEYQAKVSGTSSESTSEETQTASYIGSTNENSASSQSEVASKSTDASVETPNPYLPVQNAISSQTEPLPSSPETGSAPIVAQPVTNPSYANVAAPSTSYQAAAQPAIQPVANQPAVQPVDQPAAPFDSQPATQAASQASLPHPPNNQTVTQTSGSKSATVASKEAPEPEQTPSDAPHGGSINPAGPSIGLIQQLLDSKQDDPVQTSSALYKNATTSSRNDTSPANKTEGKENVEEDEATNEKIATESKHLEKNLEKAKQARLSVEKTKKISEISPSDAEDNDDDDDTDLDDEKAEESKSEKNVAPIVNKNRMSSKGLKNKTSTKETDKTRINKSKDLTSKEGSQDSSTSDESKKIGRKAKSSFHYEKSVSATKLKTKSKSSSKNTRSDLPSSGSNNKTYETEESLVKDDSNDMMNEESGSGSGSAEGEEGGFEESLEELNFLTGLNFEDDDYDVADDLSNEIENLESQKKFVKNDKEDFVLSHTGKNTARSHIPETPANDFSEEDESGSGSGDVEDNIQPMENKKDLKTAKLITPDITETSIEESTSKKSTPGSGKVSEKKSITGSGSISEKKSTTGSRAISDKKSITGSGSITSKKSTTDSGSILEIKSTAGSGKVSQKKSITGSGSILEKKSIAGSVSISEKKSVTGSGQDSLKKARIDGDETMSKTNSEESPARKSFMSDDNPSKKSETDEDKDEEEAGADAESGNDDDTEQPEDKDQEKQKLASDFLPEDLLPASEKERKENEQKDFGSGEPEGKISFVLKQNFNDLLKDPKSANYQMLSGNIKKDVEQTIKKAKMTDISFSEATIEGNPRQTGKTKVSFNLKSNSPSVYKDLIKLVDAGSINGLAVVKASAELDNDDDDEDGSQEVEKNTGEDDIKQ